MWRSREEITSPWSLGVITAGPRAVAFQHDHKLYLAPLDGAERPVAHAELPLGWTHGGLYTYRYRDRELLLRSDTGALVRTIARRPLGSDYVVANGSLYFIAHGELASATGARTRRLVSLAHLGMSPGPWLQPAGKLLELLDNARLVMLRPDGSVFASTPLSTGISSAPIDAPDGHTIAFATTDDRGDTQTVNLLRAGAQNATPIDRQRTKLGDCERWTSLQWRGKWLLYSNSGGDLAVIDTTRAQHAIELGGLLRRVTGTGEGFDASWASRPG